MGASSSITELRTKSKVFNEQISLSAEQFEAAATDLSTIQNKAIPSFYNENGWNDAKVLGSAAPSGSTTDPAEAKEAVAAAKALGGKAVDAANIELYVAGVVSDILSTVIMNFGFSTKLSYSHVYKSVSLGFGIQLFTTIAAQSYQNNQFFNDEYIYEYLFIYDVRFSVEQGKSEGQQNLVSLYESSIAAFEKQLSILGNEFASGEITREQYENLSQAWNSLITKYENALQSIKAALS